ncbi:hypothetical protein C8J55DRAFT_511364, partial [Lentinula edodes]
ARTQRTTLLKMWLHSNINPSLLRKIEGFGAHANQHYPLEVEIFKSSLETQSLNLLWNKYWVDTSKPIGFC